MYCKLAEKNHELEPKPFQIFLGGGVGFGSFLATAITARILRYPSQNLANLSVLVTASTGKSATNVNGITLHSEFNLPVKSALKSSG